MGIFRMNQISVQEVCCIHCGKTTRHPASTLDRILLRLVDLTKADRHIVYACPHCKHLGPAFVSAIRHSVADRILPLDGLSAFEVSIKCANKSCEAPIKTFAPMPPDTDVPLANLQMSEWTNLGITCPRGHLPEEWTLISIEKSQ